MNKQQRKEIVEAFAGVDSEVETISALDTEESREGFAADIDQLKETLEGIVNDEQEKYDNMPESLQNGSKGEEMQNGISELESAITSLEEAAAMVRDDYPEKPTEEDVETWASEVQEKLGEAHTTATGV